MGCGESKHAVATANTTFTKSKSKRSDSDNPPPVQNAANESVNMKENKIPEAIFEKKETETLENGKENTLAKQGNIGNGESREEGEGNMQTSSDKTKEDDETNSEMKKDCAETNSEMKKDCAEDRENVVAGGDRQEEEKLNSCDHSPRHFFSPTRNHEEEATESIVSGKSEGNDPATKNEEEEGSQVVTIEEKKVSSSIGEEKTHVAEKESANATSPKDVKAN